MGVMYCHATLRQWYPPGMLEFQFSGLNNTVLTTPQGAWWDVISPCLRAPPNGTDGKASAFQIFCSRRPFISTPVSVGRQDGGRGKLCIL